MKIVKKQKAKKIIEKAKRGIIRNNHRNQIIVENIKINQ